MNGTERILKTTTDNEGNIYDSYKLKRTSKSKGGWVKMYKKDFLLAMQSCIKSELDVKLFSHLVDSTSGSFIITFSHTAMAKKFGATRQKIHQFTKRCVKEGVIDKDEDGFYIFNPFIFVPKGVSDEDTFKAQEEWKVKSK